MGMLRRMDLAVGTVIGALKEEGLYENTLVFFLSGNGGPIRMHADNAPLRGHKHTFLEGGVRVPFVVQWPGALEPNVVHHPVISLDILPAAAAGVNVPENRTHDGRNLLPLMRSETDAAPHEYLVFDDHTDEWAIRGECWKLYSDEQGRRTLWPGQDQQKFHLFNLCSDIAEASDVSGQHPEVVERLKRAFRVWKKEMAPPMTAPADEIAR